MGRSEKRIKIICAYTGFYRDAGGEQHPYNLAKFLDREEFDFQVVAVEPTTSNTGTALRKTNCRFHELDRKKPSFRTPLSILGVIWDFYALFRRERPDIVHVQSFEGLIFARLAAIMARVPVIVSTENYAFEKPKGKIIWSVIDRVNAWLDRQTDHFLAVSDYVCVLRKLEDMRDRITLVPPPFNLDNFLAGRRELPGPRSRADTKNLVIGVIGRLDFDKGQDTVIRALPRVLKNWPGIRLYLYGMGDAEDELRSLTAELGIAEQVSFLGFERDVLGALDQMDVYICPSRHEALSLSIVEAMIAGVPIVASDAGGIVEAIGGGDAYFVPPDDPKALVTAILELLDELDAANLRAQANRELALDKYSHEKYVDQTAHIYRNLAFGVEQN